MEVVSRRESLAIQREAIVQAQYMIWLFTYFDVSRVVHGGRREFHAWLRMLWR